MNNYAIIHNGIVTNIASSNIQLDINWILCDNTSAYIGGTYANGIFSELPIINSPVLPILKITSIETTNTLTTTIASDFSTVSCKIGSTLTFSASILNSSNVVLSTYSGSFHLSLTASDGRTLVSNVIITNGLTSVSIPMNESGIWNVTQASINHELPDNQQLQFAGIKVYVSL